ncbi:hypothetical protein [Comamonas sp.]|uniref:hypothetical protein n=1 Tax=Comamonas sp. TaxID=34028 RepID=UPI003A8FD708
MSDWDWLLDMWFVSNKGGDGANKGHESFFKRCGKPLFVSRLRRPQAMPAQCPGCQRCLVFKRVLKISTKTRFYMTCAGLSAACPHACAAKTGIRQKLECSADGVRSALNLSRENFMLCNQILELLIPSAGAVVHKIVQRVHEQVAEAAIA